MIHMEWASQYTDFLQHKSTKVMGPINNNAIFGNQLQGNECNYKSYLIQDQDFVLLNRNTWMFIHGLYGGGPEVLYSDYLNEVKSDFVKADQNNPNGLLEGLMNMSVSLSRLSSINSGSQWPDSSTPSQMTIAQTFDSSQYAMPPIGFHNESNFCFMHAGIQGLLTIEMLNCWVLNEGKKIVEESKQLSKDGQYRWLYSFLELVISAQSKKPGASLKINSLKVLVSKQFNPKNQHDCQEFLRYFIEQLHTEVRGIDKFYQTITDIVFQGQILSTLTCQNKSCGNVSSKFESFLDISLSMQNKITLHDCLKDFFAQELIDSGYICEYCNVKTSAIKRFIIGTSPTILMIHLKRFSLYPHKVKLHGHVSFPTEINIEEYCSQKYETTYKLRSIVVHYGTPDRGHYVNFSLRQGNWYYFDDHKIYSVSETDILSQQAYLLFYQKVEDPFLQQ